MTKENLRNSIIADLGANYYSDDNTVISALLDEVINDALFISNRDQLVNSNEISTLESQLDVLSSNIRRAVKTIYLQRGAEDVKSQSLSGVSSTYDLAIESMKNDIIRSGKRIVR